MKNIWLLAVLFCSVQHVFSMKEEMRLVVVPGQNGLGGQNLEHILPKLWENRLDIKTPSARIDLGQKNCVDLLDESLQLLWTSFRKQSAILHASSQGTATAMNYYAEVNEKFNVAKTRYVNEVIESGANLRDRVRYGNLKKVKAVVFESVLLTGNSAIAHTAKCRYGISFPGSYYVLPFLIKMVMFPFYAPAGQQACFSCDSLPKDLPIIILHDEYDTQLSFKDGQALYAYLKSNDYENVYFLPIKGKGHVLLLEEKDTETNVLRAILNKHNVYEALGVEGGLSDYQPEVQPEWLDHFKDIRKKEYRIRVMDKIIKGTFVLLISYLLYMRLAI